MSARFLLYSVIIFPVVISKYLVGRYFETRQISCLYFHPGISHPLIILTCNNYYCGVGQVVVFPFLHFFYIYKWNFTLRKNYSFVLIYVFSIYGITNIQFMPWLIIHSHHSFTLLFGLPQICHGELLQMDSWVPSTASPCHFFLNTFLLFAAIRCSRIILYFPPPSPAFKHFTRDPDSFVGEWC